MSLNQIIKQGYQTKGKSKGRKTSGEFFGLTLTKKPFKGVKVSPKITRRIPRPVKWVARKVTPTELGIRRETAEEREVGRQKRLTRLGERAELQSGRARLEEQKARTRIAKRAGRGRHRSFKPFGGRVSRRIGMRLF